MRGLSGRLPYGVGQITPGWLLLVGLAATVFASGLQAYLQQLNEGLVVTNLRDIGTMGGAPWGLYVAFDVYFVGISFAGITVAALIRLLNLKELKPLSRMAELLTITALILAALAILADLGQPLRGLLNLPRYARPQSPFFGTFTLVVAGYLFASVVYFFLDGRRDAAVCARIPSPLQWFHRLWASGYQGTLEEQNRHHRTSFWLAIAIVPLLITAHSTLGFVFGLQVGRPGWYSALQAPAFVVMAGISGLGLLVLLAAVFRWALRAHDRLNLEVFQWLGRFLFILIAIYLYFTVVEVLTGMYTGGHHERRVMETLLFGDYAPIYWFSILSLVIPFALLAFQLLSHRWSVPLLVLSGLLVNLAAVGKRFLIVVPSQTHGTLLPYGTGFYLPSSVEVRIILGLLGLGTLIYALFAKVFPIMEIEEAEEAVPWRAQAVFTLPTGRAFQPRTAVTIAMVIAGFSLQALSYFVFAAPWGFPPDSPIYSNPRVVLVPTPVVASVEQWAYGVGLFLSILGSPPTLFILGVMIVFLAAVVYELWPG
ncbi:NrfD/PsrC family molybdoenzyme membrane anchor subunit [Thermoflexus sp.]|uniref:NrfD/PsrC family molybdoenzyme membrane anchor subunit n=1 Tax=Thermoflexus sp. TaxID=1969742 RepID=UPI0035E40D7A